MINVMVEKGMGLDNQQPSCLETGRRFNDQVTEPKFL
jgi:hypothetical protein